ncbi:GNAT family N-acetyltransferase [Thermoactinomyces sp. CICC 10523]|jgi:GNAT superfamily N-acetyltransferase|nr:GNAT family N-acetyltransferase [Thermoactinomyces sp. CICC 10523]MBH8604587.1 GNAT family N-acetyltransferase [Thermoactinomyces sp. CICC 10522]
MKRGVNSMTKTIIRAPESGEEQEWLRRLWQKEWGGAKMVSKGNVFHLHELSALIAIQRGKPVGAVTFAIRADAAEILSLNALIPNCGVGGSLLRAVEQKVREQGGKRICLITTNDNLNALRFYQKRGYRMVALYPGAVDEARKQKPSIPLVGNEGIPLHDEIELEKRLPGAEDSSL